MTGQEKECKWYFADQPNTQEVGPNDAMAQNFKKQPYASLVRESIQNSLDAVLDKTKPVRVKFSFKELLGFQYPELVSGLYMHIKGCLDYFSKNSNAKDIYEPMLNSFPEDCRFAKIGYIRVSDYNTKGMPFNKDDKTSPFYAFVRSAGVSSKDNDTAGGSFGFGKAAYFLISPLNTVLVSTCTDENQKVFEGITSLCTHTYQGQKKVAVGFYDDNNGTPIDDETKIPSLFRRAESGTDINILGFDLNERTDAYRQMVESVLRHFWLAIWSRKLEVEVDGDLINKDNLVDLVEDFFEDLEDSKKQASNYNPRPYFDAVRFANTSVQYVCKEAELPILGHVVLYVNKMKGASDKILFMRSLQMFVTRESCGTNYGVCALFYCDSKKGNEILRKLENPAHTEWKPANWAINNKACQDGKDAKNELDAFIKNTLSELFASKNKEAINIAGLQDFLYIPMQNDEDNDDYNEAFTGSPTGVFVEDGSSPTTDIDENSNPVKAPVDDKANVGKVLINKPKVEKPSEKGKDRTGHDKGRSKEKGGIPKPGSAKDRTTPDSNGTKGLYATPIELDYRAFSQIEETNIVHYIVLHADDDISSIRVHFFAVGEESNEELTVVYSNVGNISNNMVRDVALHTGRNIIKVRFADKMKHSLKLEMEEVTYE